MKKCSKWTRTLLAAVMVFSMLLLAACGGEPKDSESSGQSTGESSSGTESSGENAETPGGQTVDMTEGVYNAVMGSYELLIKFYDDSTYYLQNETAGFRGKYEIKEEEITFSKSQPDGTDYNSAEHPAEAEWITGNQVIYFYQEDGVTPIDVALNTCEQDAHDANTIVRGVCYAYGTQPNALAYNAETDQIQSMAGNYGSRTLSHTALRNFSINDEKAIEQAKFMVKGLPENAEAGMIESDYYLTLSQKGYETNIPVLEQWGITNGKFVQDGQTYSLTDTISGASAELTVTDEGATVTGNGETVELVVWGDVQPYAVEIVGSAMGGKIQAKVRFNEDGTLIIYGSSRNYGGTYAANVDGTITVADVDAESPVTMENVSFSEDGDHVVVTAALTIATGNEQMPTASADAVGEVTGSLYGLSGVVLLEAESEEKIFGDTGIKLEMKSDCTLTLSVGGQERVSGSWSLDMSGQVPSIAFKNVSSGELVFTLASPANITWTGKLSDTETEDRTYTFAFEASELANLQGAQAAEKYSVVTTVQKLGGAEITLTFLGDGTLTVANPKMTIATGEWAVEMNGQVPAVVFSNLSGGEMTGVLGQDYTVTWKGTITTQQGDVEVEMEFVFPSSDLANLAG